MPAPAPALLEPIHDFLAHLGLERQLSAATRAAYRADLEQFAGAAQAAGLRDWRDATSEHVTGWLFGLGEDAYAVRSLARKLSAARMFARFLVKEHYRADDFTELVQGPRLVRKLPHTLTPTEVDGLLAAPDPNTPQGLRDRAMLEVMYSSGLRVSELCGLTLHQLDIEEGLIRVIGKGDKERIAPVGSKAVAAVRRYLEEGRPALVKPRTTSEVFISQQGRALARGTFWLNLRAHAKAAGITKPVKPHLLRHSFATHMLTGGADLRVVQEILGHADIGTTQIYTHAAATDLMDEHRLYHPRNTGDV